MEIVRFDCGCLGIEPDRNGISHILESCESGSTVPNRNMQSHAYTSITESDASYVCIVGLLVDALDSHHQMRALRAALQPIIREPR